MKIGLCWYAAVVLSAFPLMMGHRQGPKPAKDPTTAGAGIGNIASPKRAVR